MDSAGLPPLATVAPYRAPGASGVGADLSRAQLRLLALLRIYCETAAIAVAGVGLVALCGWALQVGWMKSVLPGLVEMKANTAFGLIFSGTSCGLLLGAGPGTRNRDIGRLLAWLAMLIGAATSVEYATGWDLAVDQLIFNEPAHAFGTSSPGRMAPVTAGVFVAIGLALLLLDWEPRPGQRPAQWIGLAVGVIATIAIAGYIYDVSALYSSLHNIPIALNTSVAFLLLSGAVLFARPLSGIARGMTGEGPGSVMARRLLPTVVCVPLLLGWILLKGEEAGLYGPEFGFALFATASILIFAKMVWINALELNIEHQRRGLVEAEVRDLNVSLEARVAERTDAFAQQADVLNEQATMLDLAPDAIIVRDMDDHIVFWSRGAERMYGWRSDEVLGRNELALLNQEFSEPFEAIVAKLIEQERWAGEVTHHRRDGRALNVAVTWALQRDLNDAPLRILSIGHDITPRKATDARLRNTVAELERSNEELAQFANIASHDLQEPLRMVTSYTQLLSRRYKGRLDAEADEFIDFAVDGATRMQRLIQDLLAYSKIGAREIMVAEISSENALQQALKNLRGAIEESDARVTYDALPPVQADESQLAQLFQNLVGNAIKYQSAGNVPQVHITAENTSDGYWTFSVRDNGIGIEPQYFERIFGMFQRLHKRTEYAGTGIGLTMCKKIVERHGGSITVESQPGAGSTFKFTWPGGHGSEP